MILFVEQVPLYPLAHDGASQWTSIYTPHSYRSCSYFSIEEANTTCYLRLAWTIVRYGKVVKLKSWSSARTRCFSSNYPHPPHTPSPSRAGWKLAFWQPTLLPALSKPSPGRKKRANIHNSFYPLSLFWLCYPFHQSYHYTRSLWIRYMSTDLSAGLLLMSAKLSRQTQTHIKS